MYENNLSSDSLYKYGTRMVTTMGHTMENTPDLMLKMLLVIVMT